MTTKECVFCRWADNPDNTIPCRNESAIFIQNERYQGALFGSGIIIPIRHAETVFDLTEGEVNATFALLAEVKTWMEERYKPQGYNVGWNCGSVGGQEIMHAHLHVIPRFQQEPYAGRGIRHWLKQPENQWRSS
jgi:diadenosine tetraphosphate (Ap4A) HIT family hydrolase